MRMMFVIPLIASETGSADVGVTILLATSANIAKTINDLFDAMLTRKVELIVKLNF